MKLGKWYRVFLAMKEIKTASLFQTEGDENMRKMILILLAMVMLSGCTYTLPSNFAERAQTDLSTKFLLYQNAWWSKEYPVRGVLVCDEERLMFVVLDDTLNKYICILDLRFKDEIKNVSVIGADLRKINLAIYGKGETYNFRIVKEGYAVDRVMTYEFAVFIAGKLNQNAEQFAVELEKEKKEQKN